MSFYTSCPVVKRSVQTLHQWVDVGCERKKIDFDKEIIWLIESESQLLFRHGGMVLHEGSTTNDYYGYLTSTNIAGPSPAEIAAGFSITNSSSLELVVLTSVFTLAVIETEQDAIHNLKKRENCRSMYSNFPSSWRVSIESLDPFEPPCKLNRVDLASSVTWSSKNSVEENSDLLAHFVKLWKV